MKKFKKILLWMGEKLLIAGSVLVALYPSSPSNMPLTYRDSGVFLYMGWRMLNGDVPYLNVWDHKPPVIFFINALGLFLGQGSRWGVWFLEFLFLLVATWVGFRLLKKSFGLATAVISTTLWLLTFEFIYQGGNLTTEYTLPLQFLALALVYDVDSTGSKIRWLLIGLLGGVVFMTKQVSIGIWLAIGLYLLFQRLRSRQVSRLVKELFLMFLGVAIIILGFVVYFAYHHALSQFWDAAFAYNFVYASVGNKARLFSILMGVAPLTWMGLFQFALIGYFLALASVYFKENDFASHSLVIIALIDLPLEVLLTSISGRSYPHYYMTLLPVLAFFSGVVFWYFFSRISFLQKSRMTERIFVVAILMVFLWEGYSGYRKQVFALRKVGNKAAVEYILSTTKSEDYVLLWGADSGINFFTQRRSPTRFVYQYPLYKENYTNEQMVVEFLDDIIHYQPKLIIDTHNKKTPMYNFPVSSDEIREKITYIQEHYPPTGIELRGWAVYKYQENPAP